MIARRAFPVFLLVLISPFAAPLFGQVVINEVDYDQVGTDSAEFLELKNVGAGVVNLDNYTVQLVNGNAGGAAVYDTIDLPNVNLAAGDYYVICANSATVINCDLDDGPNTDFIQNGAPDGIGLRLSGTLVDAYSYEGNTGAPYTETAGSAVGIADSNTVAFIGHSRFPDGADTNNNSADFSVRCITPGTANLAANSGCTAPTVPLTLNIGDVTQVETDGGTTTFTFAVTLTSPAGPGGVTFDIATADGTAQDDNPIGEDEDYVAQSLTGQSIPMGSTGPYNFNVTVNGDTEVEPNETFFVNVTTIVGATAGDTQGQGTISNDDLTVVLIHDVQGPGTSSAIVGSSVTVRGIVTGVKSNGFFVQEEDADTDADPMTSEGIFVFTSGAPPAAAAFTAQVQVTGTVAEFVPSADPQQPPVTELTSPTTVQLAAPGQPLPTAILLTPTFPDPAGPFDQLERVEGMRVSAASITVVAPSDGSVNEPNNTGTSNGRFFGVVTGVARPFREPGIRHPDTPPVGSIPPIPRWDTNPERLRIESATINAQPILTVKSGDIVAPVVGPLDYGFRGYAIYPDGTLGTPVITPGTLPTTVTTPTAQEFTVASFNIFHFYDTVDVLSPNPGNGDVALTPAAYADRLNKASIAIRNNLKTPDVVGLQEVENLTVLQDLATKINNDAVANAQPDPMYVAYLSEGNDVGGIDVGYLVKTAPVAGGAPRVLVNSVTQIGAADTWVDPDDGNLALLNDRPSLVLDAVINRAPGASFPVIVINNHLRSLIGIDSNAPDGLTTEGDRVRRKRQTQADRLAQYIQGRLTGDPNEHIVLVGDFNAFEFNDGYTDPINTISGTPPPDAETVVCSTCPTLPNTNDGSDQVNPDLVNLVNTPPAVERYSYIHDGNAQNIDHAIISAGLVTDTTARRIEHPRINTDYPETERSNNATALRISDHDPLVAFFTADALAIADVSITKTLDTTGPYFAGQSVTYTLDVANAGPDTATNIQVTDTPTNLSITSVTGSGCASLPCNITSLAAGANTTITVTATIVAADAFDNSADANATEADPNSANNTDNTGNGDTATSQADVSLTKTLDTAGPYYAGQSVTYTIVVANAGPSTATNISVTDTPSNLTITNVSGACASFSPCTIASLASGANTSITVTATIVAAGAFDNSADANAAEPDPSAANNTDNTGNGGTAAASADVSITKTLDTAGPFFAGQTVNYTIVVTNNGPSTATNIQVTDTPTNLTITSVQSTACSSFPCTIPSLPGSSFENIAVIATIDAAGTFDNSVNATGTENDPDTANNTDNTGNGDTATSQADVSLTKTLDTAGPYNVGQSITYTIFVANAGPSTATTINVTDSPTNLTITNVSGACTSFSPCTIAALASGANTNITVTATIDAVGAFDNSATATPAETDPDLSNNTDNTGNGGTTENAADVQVVKSIVTPGPYHQGDTVSFQTVVSNNGPNTATNVVVTDTPIGVSLVAGSVSGAGCTAFPCTIPSLANGASDTITYSGTIQNPGSFDNSTTVAATEFDPNTSNNSDLFGNGGVAQNTVDVAITKTLDTLGPYAPGQTIQYTLVVSNAGPGVALFVEVTDSPTNLTITSVSGAGCTAFPCTLVPGITPTPASNRTIIVTATIDALGPFDNSATATQRSSDFDPNPANNTDNTGNGGEAVSADVSITKTMTSTGPYQPGDTVTYVLDIFNAGPNPASNIVVTDTPTNLTFASSTDGGGGCTSLPCTVPSLNPTNHQTITVNFTVTSTGAFDNSASANAAEGDPNPSNNTDNTGNGGTTGPRADVSVVKSIITAGPYKLGQTGVQWQIVVSNAGPDPATNVVVSDTPIGVSFTSVSGSGCTAFPCTIPSLAVGANTTINMTGTINSTGSFDNSASVAAAEFDPNTANNSDLFGNGGVASNAVDVAITKTLDTPGPYTAGQSITYTLVVSNVGPGVALFVEVTDTPTNLTITSVSGAGCTAFPCTLVPGVTPTPASNRTITVTATINAPGAFDNSATATARASDVENDLSNNTDNTGNGGVATAGSYTATKSVAGTFTIGSSVTYTVVLTNNTGFVLADNAGDEFTDILPASLALTSATAPSGTAVANTGTNTVTWNGALANGASVIITINAAIVAASGAVSNQGTASVDFDADNTNETNVPTDDPSTATPGDATVFTIATDSDGDGVDDVIEQAAPNGGDGNGDNIPDYLQNTVASIPAATGSGYLTLQSSCTLLEVYVTTPGALPTPDPGFHYPHGLIAFRAPCSSATFSLFVYGSGAVSSYRKFGPLPPGGPQQWYGLPGAVFSTATVGSLNPRRIDFSLTDGGTGDDTPVDGVIVDQGGPADPAVGIPTLDEVALLALAAMLAAIALLVMKR